MMRESTYNVNDFAHKEIVDASELDLSEKNRKTYELLKDRINDYREACKYMTEVVGNSKKALEFLKVGEKMKKMLDSLAQGIAIDILKVDPPISPALILGYSEDERQESNFTAHLTVY